MSHDAQHESYATTEILKPRAQWIERRRAEVERTGDRNLSQMHYARLGRITEEMEFVARREELDAEMVAGLPGRHDEQRSCGAARPVDRVVVTLRRDSPHIWAQRPTCPCVFLSALLKYSCSMRTRACTGAIRTPASSPPPIATIRAVWVLPG